MYMYRLPPAAAPAALRPPAAAPPDFSATPAAPRKYTGVFNPSEYQNIGNNFVGSI
jgi:hypothetical protein